MRDWADSEDHDYLNEWVGKRITAVTTGARDGEPWLRLHLNDGSVREVYAEFWRDEVHLNVQDHE